MSIRTRITPMELQILLTYNVYITLAIGGILMDMIKGSTNSRTAAVAGAIAGIVREHRRAEVQAIGAGAVNQAMKAAAIARGYLLLDGINVIIIPSFSD